MCPRDPECRQEPHLGDPPVLRLVDDREKDIDLLYFGGARSGEASIMARRTGKTGAHNLEPEDLRAITLAVAHASLANKCKISYIL